MFKHKRSFLLLPLVIVLWGNVNLKSQCPVDLVNQLYIQSAANATLQVQGLPNYQAIYNWTLGTELSGIDILAEGEDFIELGVDENALSTTGFLYYTYLDINCTVFDSVEINIIGVDAFALSGISPIICADILGEDLDLDCNCNSIEGLHFDLFDDTGNTLFSDISGLPSSLSPGAYSIQLNWTSLGISCDNCVLSDLGTFNIPFQLSDALSPTLVCNNQVNISLDNDCQFQLSPDQLSEMLSMEDALEMEIQIFNGNALVEEIGAEHIGLSLDYKLLHKCSGNYCSGLVFVEDKIAPVFDPVNIDLIKICGDDTSVDAPLAFDNCYQSVEVNLVSASVEEFDCISNAGLIKQETRSYTAIDNQGNVSEIFTQNIRTRLPLLTEIQWPSDLNDIGSPSLNCQQSGMTDPSFTGYPSAFGLNLVPGEDYCGLIVNYSDQLFSACGESFTIIRNWQIFRTCSSLTESMEHNQLILVKDKLDPFIDCPDYLEINVDNNCGLENWIPEFWVEDDCSSLSWTLSGEGWFIHEGESVDFISLGQQEIKLTATDECGNVSNCFVDLDIKDSQSPTAICLDYLEVSLDTEGKAILNYTSIDNGSFDNCSLELDYELRRMDGPLGETILVTCDDMESSPIIVEMQISDEDSNKNSCMVELELSDKINPQITCPSLVTANCSDIANWSEKWGEPIFSDNCGIDSIIMEVDSSLLNLNCYTGSISRLVRVFDASGNESSCVQLMEWSGTNPLVESTITWPDDILLDGCSGDFDPDSLLLEGSQPIITNEVCGIVGVNYSDQVFYTGGEECFKIMRSWAVLDWCHYDEEMGLGLFEMQQEIRVVDNDAPVVDCDIVPFVKLDSPDCFGEITLELPYIIEECSDQIDIEVNSIFGQGIGPFMDVGLGTYELTYYISDACGNTTTCVVDLFVSDAKVPTAYCVDELVVDMPLEQELSIAAQDFDFASYDNCTQEEELRFSFTVFPWDSVQVFDCTNVGLNAVSMYVFDAENNFDYCNVTLNIQDNFNYCMLPTPTLSGAVADINGLGIEGVDVLLNGTTSLSVFTDINGAFQIADLPVGGDYSLLPQFLDGDAMEGVTTYDLVLISQHVLGIQPFQNPYQWIAADVNDSGSITTLDIVAIRKMILQINSSFPNGKSWKFIADDFDFPTSGNPLALGYPELLNINNLEDELSDLNFRAVKLGNVNP